MQISSHLTTNPTKNTNSELTFAIAKEHLLVYVLTSAPKSKETLECFELFFKESLEENIALRINDTLQKITNQQSKEATFAVAVLDTENSNLYINNSEDFDVFLISNTHTKKLTASKTIKVTQLLEATTASYTKEIPIQIDKSVSVFMASKNFTENSTDIEWYLSKIHRIFYNYNYFELLEKDVLNTGVDNTTAIFFRVIVKDDTAWNEQLKIFDTLQEHIQAKDEEKTLATLTEISFFYQENTIAYYKGLIVLAQKIAFNSTKVSQRLQSHIKAVERFIES